MRKPSSTQRVDTVFALLIFCAFAAAVLLVLLLGVRVYEKVAARSDEAYDQRIALSYISAKIRHADTQENIYVGSFEGYEKHPEIGVLYLEEDYDSATYHTMIYFSDGWIRELYCEKGLAFNPEDGEAILEAQALSFETEENGLIRIICTDQNGVRMSIFVLPRCKGGLAL